MPDILIRGMEMPTGKLTYREIQIWSDGCVLVRKGLAGQMQETGAVAVELPEHGDLIDREWLKEMAYSKVEDFGGAFLDTIDIAIAPVIVPADKEDTP